MGEVTYICCVAIDTLGWVSEQMDPRRDAGQVALAVADEPVWTTQFATAAEPPEGWATMEDRGWTTEPPLARSASSSPPANAHPSWSDGVVRAPMAAACRGAL